MSNKNIHIQNGNYNENIKGDYLEVRITDDDDTKYTKSEVNQEIDIKDGKSKVVQSSRNTTITGGTLNVSGACAFNQGDITRKVFNYKVDEQVDDIMSGLEAMIDSQLTRSITKLIEQIMADFSTRGTFRIATKVYKALDDQDLDFLNEHKEAFKNKFGSNLIHQILLLADYED